MLTDVPRLLGEGVNIFSDAPRDGPPADPQVVLEVERSSGDGDGRAVSSRQVRIDLSSWEDRRAFVGDIAWAGVEANTFWVQPGSPAAEAGLRSGDIVLTVDGKPSKGLETLTEAFDPEAEVQKPIEMVVLRDDGRETITVTAKKLPRNTYAALAFELEIPREDVTVPFSESFGVGVIHTGRMINRVVSTLGSLIRGRVSPKHLGGIITIFRVSKQTSKIAFMRLLLFLAMVSINLAILNILPIPVLDGGWLVFLIIEKIKGSPVTETTMAYFQWAGLIFILGLMGYVTWNDIQRLISGS